MATGCCDLTGANPSGKIGKFLALWLEAEADVKLDAATWREGLSVEDAQIVADLARLDTETDEIDGPMPSYCVFYAAWAEDYREEFEADPPCDHPIWEEAISLGCGEWMGECDPGE